MTLTYGKEQWRVTEIFEKELLHYCKKSTKNERHILCVFQKNQMEADAFVDMKPGIVRYFHQKF